MIDRIKQFFCKHDMEFYMTAGMMDAPTMTFSTQDCIEWKCKCKKCELSYVKIQSVASFKDSALKRDAEQQQKIRQLQEFVLSLQSQVLSY